MSHSLLIFCILFILTPENCRSRSSPSHRIIDTKRGDDYVLNCPIERNNQTLPSILQWYRGKNNYSTPIASQFDDFPVHIDDPYLDRYTLIGNSSLRIVNIHLNDNDTYECRLILIDRGLLETKETYSSTLRVNEEPRFLNQSTSLQIAAHYSTVTLLCEVYAVPRATMTWYKVFDEGKRESQLLPVNTHRLTLENVDDRMAGRYKCLAQNRLGSVENQFQLLIRGSIYWRHFPVSQTVKINQSVTLKCEGESSEPLQYQWLKDEAFLSDRTSSDNRMRTYSDGVLTIDFIQPADHGSYVCMISSIPNVTQIRSKPAVITVRYPPLPTRDRPSQNLTFIRGRPGECPCLLDAYPPIQSVSWYRNGKAIRIETKAGAYRINGGYSLAIRSSDTKDRGEYFCRAQNSEGFGRDSQTFYVDIRDPIRFLLKPNASYHVQPGDRLTLPCMVSAQPAATIKWFKNSVEFSASNGNVTLERIDKSDHGFYACQASNRYTTSNTSTLLIVENTTPQAPENIRFEQRSANLFLSWQAGYDGGRSQHFILWYRLISKKKDNWNQILILPGNATEFLLFDLKMRQTYEVTIVGENELGLGTFSSIVTVHMNPSSDLPMDYLYHSNATDSYRPPSPTNLRLFHSGSNLHVIWDHSESSVPITHYVLRWRSTILFNNEGSQRFLVLPYPIHSYLLKEIKQSKYAVQLLAYSNEGTYSAAIESEINIRFHSILAYHGSTSQLVSVLCFLSVLTVAIVCIGLFLAVRSYHRRQSYWTDLESAGKVTCCWCFPSIHYGPGDCSRLNAERHHASLLKANDLRASPLYMSHQRTEPRPPSPGNSAKKAMHDDTAMVSLFQPIAMENELNLTQSDGENRKNITRPPLEAVPELSELDTDHHQRRRSSYVPPLASPVSLAKQSHSTQPGPLLVTFDSGSLQRR